MEHGVAQSEPAPGTIEDLYRRAGGERYGIALGEFAAILREVATDYGRSAGPGEVSDGVTDAQVVEFWLKGERFLPDLALARGCARGSNAAWELFIERFRPQLYRTALALTGEESSAWELADSVYSELFGLPKADGRRVSKLDYYAGLGSLEGWLKVVLAQEYTNRYRRTKREISLEEEDDTGTPLKDRLRAPDCAAESDSAADHRLVSAIDEALVQLQPSQRLILTCYFLEGWKLAQIALMLGVHESTVSRRIERTTGDLRNAILAGLRRRGMSSREARDALETDVRRVLVDVGARLRSTEPQEGSG